MPVDGVKGVKADKIASYFSQHWLLYSVFLSLSISWPMILDWFGDRWYLTSMGKLTNFGKTTTIVIILISAASILFTNYRSSLKDSTIVSKRKQYKDSMELLGNILEIIHEICKSKYDSLISNIESVIHDKSQVPTIVSNPSQQINRIISGLSNCICRITDLKRKNVFVSLAIHFPIISGDKWHWSDFCEVREGLPLDQLISNPRTTFHIVFSGENGFVFFNNKEKAVLEKHYVPDKRDNDNRCIGSIVCRKIVIGKPSEDYGEAILTITTYGKKFVDDDNREMCDNVEENIKETLLYEFESRIQIELALLLLEKLSHQALAEKASA